MTRLAALLLASIALLSVLSLVVGHAATLEVRGGIAQTFRIEVEPPPTADLWVEVREFAGQSGNQTGTTTLGPHRLRIDQTYHVDFLDGQLRACPDSPAVTEPGAGGPFSLSSDETHVLCVQKSQGWSVVVRAGGSGASVVTPTAPDDAAVSE